jgi:sulfate-transporting ATPase
VFGDRLLFDDVSFTVPKGAIVGIIGANGMGKSTLFRLLMGHEQPDGGSVTVGETVQLGYVDQSRDDLDGSKTVWEEVSDGLDIIRIGTYEVPSRSYIGRFNFKGSDQQKFVKDLSGGERNRLHLAKLLKQGANVCYCWTNPPTISMWKRLRALEDAVQAFPGSAMVISHDRWFLDRIATHILAYEDDGTVVFHEGNYSEYEEDRRSRLRSRRRCSQQGQAPKTNVANVGVSNAAIALNRRAQWPHRVEIQAER